MAGLVSLARRAASIVALALVCATALPPVLHPDSDDLACETGTPSGSGQPSIGTGVSADGPAHCEVCHWLQSVRACHVVHQRLPRLQPVPSSLSAAADLDVGAPGLPRRSPRAPPLT